MAERYFLFGCLVLVMFLTGCGIWYYRIWRKRADRIISQFQDLYGTLLQVDYPRSEKKKVLDELTEVFFHLEEALNKALISSLALKQAEINVLQSQINPHFLYNILDSIRGQALSEGVPEIADMTEALANYFRYCVTKDDGIVTLADELKNVENYWRIQQYRFGNKISMQISMDRESICPDEYEIPKLILQPIVENAIFHGLETKQGIGKVMIRIERTLSRLIIEVSDDGIGMEESELERLREQLKEKQHVITKKDSGSQHGSGIALLNVNERIKLHYGDEYGLQISSSHLTGTEVEFVLPIRAPVQHHSKFV
jgi:two-component system sensor histidine kinase YesM